MPFDISTISNSTAQTKKTDEQKHVKIVHSDSTDKSVSGKASLSPDSISLTDTAQRIKTLEEQVARLPIVDTQKIEQIKNSIDDGSYDFNPQRIAEKMIKFEKDLQ